MGKKPDRRILVRLRRSKLKVQRRKYAPPVRGLAATLQESNRTVIASIEAKMKAQA